MNTPKTDSDWSPLSVIADQVKSGKSKAVDLVERALKNIETQKEFNSVIASITERSRERAKQVDKLVSTGKNPGRLAGVPFLAKDNFLTFGSETTAASNILKGFEAPYQATAISKLEEEGAICVGKANLDAFAHGSSTENSDFMTTLNPHDKTKVPGGSSGGSAAAVILNIVPFALGTDTGGSIRLPAAYCGAVGYKPTYGLVSRSGVIAMSSSTDVIGPLTKSVEDAALVLEVMSGKDPLDSTTIDRDKSQYDQLKGSMKGQKIGLVKEYMNDDLDNVVKKNVLEATDKLKLAGAEIIEVSLPGLPMALACYYILCPAEVSSNLSRYDGQRYGFSHPDAQNLDESYKKTRSQGFGKEAKRRIMIGTYVLSSGYYDAYYKKAQQLRTKLINEFNEAFTKVDFLIGPTAPGPAFEVGSQTKDPLQMYLTDIMTVAANLVGVPAISIPSGLQDGLPLGLQIMAPQKHDKQLLSLAKTAEELI